jgi:hypothetical protein
VDAAAAPGDTLIAGSMVPLVVDATEMRGEPVESAAVRWSAPADLPWTGAEARRAGRERKHNPPVGGEVDGHLTREGAKRKARRRSPIAR